MRSSLFTTNAFNEQLDPEVLGARNNDLNISVKRLDLIDRIWGGNKLFKLQLNLEHALSNRYDGVLTFGGAYSNHIAATSALAADKGLKSVGLIRGERPTKISVTLERAEQLGMKLEFISREQYKKKNESSFLAMLQDEYPDLFIIPEGGANELGIEGCRSILDQEDKKFDHILVAGGTGGTACGIISSCSGAQFVTCVAALKDGPSIKDLIRKNLTGNTTDWEVNDDYTFGGFAKSDPILDQFVGDFTIRSGIPIEPVYTGKLFFGIRDMLHKGRLNRGNNILVIHTGGLQYLDY